jgi:hypothetical protein
VATITKGQSASQSPSAPRTDLPDPLLTEGRHYTVVKKGQLFVDGVDGDDPFQGKRPDCWLIASMSAIAFQQPQLIESLVTANADGTVTVHFKDPDAGEPYKQYDATVDVEVPADENKNYAYAYARNYELWPSLVEKAYVQQFVENDYAKLDGGGRPAYGLELLTGLPGQRMGITDAQRKGVVTKTDGRTLGDARQTLFDTIRGLLASGAPVVANTGSQIDETKGPPFVKSHSYPVLQAFEENGQHYFELRNPWGRRDGAAPPRDGVDDARVIVSMEEFVEVMTDIDYVSPPAPRRTID